jgi:pimeloyl-ACP methyl ester carboxylesterase/DNA-binding CsgD family transcriptional regulator
VAVQRPVVWYARATDGVSIAFASVGDGPIAVVLVPPLVSQIDLMWDEPAFERFVTRLATAARCILLDRRGTGLSDHVAATDDNLSLLTLSADLAAVLDAAGVDRAVVVGASLGAMTAVRFAHDFPHRAEAIVLIGGNARFLQACDYEFGLDPALLDDWIAGAAARWGTGALVEADAPAVQFDDRYRAWGARLERHACTPGLVADSLRIAASYDLRPLLGAIAVPTLVVHRLDDAAISIDHARYLAAHIPHAELAELPGDEHTFFLGDQRSMLKVITDFVDRHVPAAEMRAASRRAERRDAYGSGWDSLTASEREVAALVATGLTNKEIADRLRLSAYTVDGRLRRIFSKLRVSNRSAVASEYARAGRPGA